MKLFSKKLLIGLICVFFLILLGFSIIKTYFDFNENSKIYTANALDIIDQRMTALFFEINNFPRGVGNDVLFLSGLSSLERLINAGSQDFRGQKIKDLEKDFLGFFRENKAYYQLRYIDENGYEIVRVDFDGQNYKVIPRSSLQDKSLRYYFDETIKLDEREVYISPLDLNIEDGELENRGTEEDPVYVPAIRYGTPVFSHQGKPKGIVISNIYADYFLEDIRRFQREEETIFLVNEKGYYLAHPDRDKEFAFILGKDDNFYNDYPVVPGEILSDFNKRRIETDDSIFSFRRIYPTIGSFEVHEGAEKTFGENSEKNYFWVLVSVSEKGEINKVLGSLEKDYLFFLLSSGTIILIIIVLIFLLAFKSSERRLFNGKKK